MSSEHTLGLRTEVDTIVGREVVGTRVEVVERWEYVLRLGPKVTLRLGPEVGGQVAVEVELRLVSRPTTVPVVVGVTRGPPLRPLNLTLPVVIPPGQGRP